MKNNEKYFTDEERKLVKNEKAKKYYQNHKEDKQIYQKNNKKKIKIKKHEYYENNKEKIKLKVNEYNQNHKKERNEYINNKLKTDINFKLAHNLRNRLYIALCGDFKSGSAIKDLGCTIPELKTYLESKFQEGMTWKNWKHNGWHIDHIIPLDSFDLSNREEFLKACHYTNLQPLWAEENWTKGITKTINKSR
jgi:hypothetical protein